MIEVEVKALVSDVQRIKKNIESLGTFDSVVESSQLNHYFHTNLENTHDFLNRVEQHFSVSLPEDIYGVDNITVRTRFDSVKGVLLIFKYSVVDDNAQNGNVRREIELPIKDDINTLDGWLLNQGFNYQSKWSRERVEYKSEDFNICLDKNAGYGYLLEVEILLTDIDINKQSAALVRCRNILQQLNLTELDSTLLKKMFEFYSANFNDFYGTDKTIFTDSRFTY